MAVRVLMRGGIYVLFVISVIAGWVLRKRRARVLNYARTGSTKTPSASEVKYASWQVRLHSVRQLTNAQDTQAALAQLAAILDDPDSDVWEAAAEVMGGYGPAAIPYLEEVLASSSLNSRIAAVGAMSLMTDAATIPILSVALSDESAWVRQRAAQALGTIHDSQAVPNLRTALQTETDADVRAAIENALRSSGSNPAQ